MNLIKEMDKRGLSSKKFTRIERADGKPVPPGYNPASDIVNLLPAILSASVNDLIGSHTEEEVDNLTGIIFRQILPELYRGLPDKEGDYSDLAGRLSDRFKELYSGNAGMMFLLTRSFMYFSLIAYAVAVKNGLREMPTLMGGNGVFRYFAMLGVWDKLSRDTRDAVVKELAEQNLWGATPDVE